MDPGAIPGGNEPQAGWWGAVTLALTGAIGFLVRHVVPAKKNGSDIEELTGRIDDMSAEIQQQRLTLNAIVTMQDRLVAVQERIAAAHEQNCALLDGINRHLILESERAKDGREQTRQLLRDLR